jgi:hypothetical protein
VIARFCTLAGGVIASNEGYPVVRRGRLRHRALIDYFRDFIVIRTDRQNVRAPQREDGEHLDCKLFDAVSVKKKISAYRSTGGKDDLTIS